MSLLLSLIDGTFIKPDADLCHVLAVGSLVSSTLITCQTPEWSDELWEFYRADLEGKALVQVMGTDMRSNETRVIFSSTGVFHHFEAINKAPDFLGSSIGIASREAYDSQPILLSNWTRKIWKGRQIDGQDSPDEQDQSLTFVVRARVPSFFEVCSMNALSIAS